MAEKDKAAEAAEPQKAAPKKAAAPKAAAEKKAPAAKAAPKAAAKASADKPAAKAPAKASAAKASAAADAPKAATAKAPAKKAAAKDDAPASRPGVLKVHHLRPVPGANKPKTRVGRGEGSKGKTAGRGTKGTKARTPCASGSRVGRCRCTCAPRSCAGSRTRSASSTRS